MASEAIAIPSQSGTQQRVRSDSYLSASGVFSLSSSSQQSKSFDPTKIDCECGHADCEAILDKKKQRRRSSEAQHVAAPSESRIDGENDVRSFKAQLADEYRAGKSLKRIFFSPHPDDVAYSCFGLVSSTSEQDDDFIEGGWVEANRHAESGVYDRSGSSSDGSSNSGSGRSRRRDSQSTQASSSSSAFTAVSPELGKPTEGAGRSHAPRNPYPGHPDANSDEWQESVIVTVFSKSRCANGRIGASLRHCVNQTTQMREGEDQRFAASVGARLFSLGFADTSARDEGSRFPELLTQTSSQATTFALTVDHPAFENVRQRIMPIVEWAVECNATIFIPVAVGCHIDHWMVRVAVLSALVDLEHRTQWNRMRAASKQMRMSGIDPIHILNMSESPSAGPQHGYSTSSRSMSVYGSHLVFYEDLPYAFISSDDMLRRTVANFLPRDVECRLIPIDFKAKVRAVESYASQMKGTLIEMLHDHAVLLAKRSAQLDPLWQDAPEHWSMAERCWILKDVCGLSANLLASLSSRATTRDERLQSPKALGLALEEQLSISPQAFKRTPLVHFTSPFSDAPSCLQHRADGAFAPSSPHSPPLSPQFARQRLLRQPSGFSPRQVIDDLPFVPFATAAGHVGRAVAGAAADADRHEPTPRRMTVSRPGLRRMSTCPPQAFPLHRNKQAPE